jgi:hypothetical protein
MLLAMLGRYANAVEFALAALQLLFGVIHNVLGILFSQIVILCIQTKYCTPSGKDYILKIIVVNRLCARR